MFRKIIQQSPTSLGISLPKKWINKLNLKKGGTLDVIEEEGRLIVSADSKPAFKKTELNSSDYGPLLRRAFDAAYKKGYDEVTIFLEKPEDLTSISEAIKLEANTFEVISSAENKVIIRAISEISKEEFNNLLSRTLFMLKEQSNLLAEYSVSGKKDNLKKILEFERANNKLTHLCRRALHKGISDENNMLLYAFVELLEKVADEFKFLCQNIPKKLSRDAKKLIEGVGMLIDLTSSSYLKFETEKSRQAYAQRKTNAELGFGILQDAKQKKMNILTHHLLNINELVFDILSITLAIKI